MVEFKRPDANTWEVHFSDSEVLELRASSRWVVFSLFDSGSGEFRQVRIKGDQLDRIDLQRTGTYQREGGEEYEVWLCGLVFARSNHNFTGNDTRLWDFEDYDWRRVIHCEMLESREEAEQYADTIQGAFDLALSYARR